MGLARKHPRDLGERITANIVADPGSGCWHWTLRLDPSGYGTLRFLGKQQFAHRASYRAFKGEIPDNLPLDHLCRTPDCVNPAHLEAVTIGENTRRGNSVWGINAKKSHCIRGHALSGENLKTAANGSRQCRECLHIRANARSKSKRNMA